MPTAADRHESPGIGIEPNREDVRGPGSAPPLSGEREREIASDLYSRRERGRDECERR